MASKMMNPKIIGCGGYLPAKTLTNFDLEKTLDTSDEWIKTRTGISQRSIVSPGETTFDIALKAAEEAISSSQIIKSEIDLIIVCTTTPDRSFPSIACKLQQALGLKEIPAFDLQAVCSGFVYGMDVAKNMMKFGSYNTVLLVCAERMSSLLDWQDRSTAVLFGDGAGAVVLQNKSGQNKNGQNNQDSDQDSDQGGIIDSQIGADGAYYDMLYTDQGSIKMDGRSVFKMAVEKMSESVLSILAKNNIKLSEVDYLIPHQANIRIINSLAKKMQLNDHQIITTIDKHANCSAASIPLALNEHLKQNSFKKGDIIIFVAFGAGATWGSVIYRW